MKVFYKKITFVIKGEKEQKQKSYFKDAIVGSIFNNGRIWGNVYLMNVNCVLRGGTEKL